MPENKLNLQINSIFLGINRGESYNTYTGVNVKVYLILISLLSVSSLSFADIGEKTHEFMPDEFLMKSYIRAHEATVTKRVNLYNRSRKNWLPQHLDKKSKAEMNKLFDLAGTRQLEKITKKDHFYNIKVASVNISFSTADLILDRIYIAGKLFEISQKESLPEFQARLRSFLKKSRKPKRTSFLSFIIPEAHAINFTALNEDRLESMVVLNATGVISITYDVKWPWIKSEYAVDLANALTDELNSAYDECTRKSQQLSDVSFRRMDDSMKKIIDSMKTEGKIDRSKLISSLLKKFSVKKAVDAESETDKGTYKPIQGQCNSFDTKNPGIMQQMFPTLTRNPTDTTKDYNSWLTGNSAIGNDVNAKRGVCDAIDRTVSCLEGLEGIEKKNIANQSSGVVQKIKFSRISVFDEVNGTKSNAK